MLEMSATNANHHLWNNHGTWWVHATVIHRGLVQERVRRSLKTADVVEARRRRDLFLLDLAAQQDVQLSIRVRARAQREREGNDARHP